MCGCNYSGKRDSQILIIHVMVGVHVGVPAFAKDSGKCLYISDTASRFRKFPCKNIASKVILSHKIHTLPPTVRGSHPVYHPNVFFITINYQGWKSESSLLKHDYYSCSLTRQCGQGKVQQVCLQKKATVTVLNNVLFNWQYYHAQCLPLKSLKYIALQLIIVQQRIAS